MSPSVLGRLLCPRECQLQHQLLGASVGIKLSECEKQDFAQTQILHLFENPSKSVSSCCLHVVTSEPCVVRPGVSRCGTPVTMWFCELSLTVNE